MAPHWRSRQRHYKQKLRFEIVLFAVGAIVIGFLFSTWADAQMKSSAAYRHSLAGPYSLQAASSSSTLSEIMQKQTVETDWDAYTSHDKKQPETEQPVEEAQKNPADPARPESFDQAHGRLVEEQSPAPGASYAWVEIILPAAMESTMPVVMETAMNRLTSAMDAAGERSLARRFTEDEFNRFVVAYINRESRGQLRGMRISLRPEGFLFQAQAALGKDHFPVSGLIRFSVAGNSPKLSVQELKIATHTVSEKTCVQLEKMVNQKLAQQNYPLQVKEFQMKDGAIWMSVERR
jgi:hypothetical protein